MTFVSENTPMLACDGCGVVAAAHIALDTGWRPFYPGPPGNAAAVKHHCPQCTDRNTLVAAGLVHKVDRSTAVTYDEVVNGQSLI